MAQNTFGNVINVADEKPRLLAHDAELLADLERSLPGNGSAGENLWGFNLYPEEN